jgi:drug/metabolite transporter (DMT)-like permease
LLTFFDIFAARDKKSCSHFAWTSLAGVGFMRKIESSVNQIFSYRYHIIILKCADSMQYIGEILSLVVAVAWTGAALFSEAATLRIGTIVLNVIRMAGSLLVLGVILWVVTGFPLPQYLNAEAWLWLSLSGLVGYVFGDYCLFNSYLTIGSRYGQLFMTLAPLAAALAGWLILGEKMSMMGILGMLVVGTGIGMSVLNKGGSGQHRPHLKLPVRGVLMASVPLWDRALDSC